MNKYKIGFKWKDGREDYVTIKSSANPTQVAREFKEKDETGNLEVVYVRLLVG
jgi:hypothetical protein